MHQGEFYSAKEFNATSEYRHFPAEVYIKPREENACGREDADLGREATTLQAKPKKATRSNAAKSIVDKVFNSVRGAATVATVSAALVVGGAIAVSAPKAEPIAITSTDTAITYEIKVEGLEEKGEYAFRLSDGEQTFFEEELDGDGVYQGTVEGLIPETEYTLSLIEYSAFLGEVQHFTERIKTLGTALNPIPPPEVEITRLSIVGLNTIRIDFTHKNLPQEGEVTFDLLYGNLVSEAVLLSETDIQNGYVTVTEVKSATMTVTPTVTVKEEQTKGDSFTHTFSETLMADMTVGLGVSNQRVTFFLQGISSEAAYIHLTSSEKPEEPEFLWIEEVVEVFYDTQGVITYTLYFTNENGDKLSNEVSFTVDTSIPIPEAEYNFYFYNTGDIGVTYNEDGTVNIYIPTEFSSENEDVYYQILLGSIRYSSREPLAKFEHIPNTNYPLRYDICIDIDGVEYSFLSQTPSGTVNEPNFYVYGEWADDTLLLQLEKELLYMDLDSVLLRLSNGEEMTLSASDFVYNEENSTYDLSLPLSPAVTWVTIQVLANPNYTPQLEAISYIGNLRTQFEATVEKP